MRRRSRPSVKLLRAKFYVYTWLRRRRGGLTRDAIDARGTQEAESRTLFMASFPLELEGMGGWNSRVEWWSRGKGLRRRRQAFLKLAPLGEVGQVRVRHDGAVQRARRRRRRVVAADDVQGVGRHAA